MKRSAFVDVSSDRRRMHGGVQGPVHSAQQPQRILDFCLQGSQNGALEELRIPIRKSVKQQDWKAMT